MNKHMKKSEMIQKLEDFYYEKFGKDYYSTYLAMDTLDFLEKEGMNPPFNSEEYMKTYRDNPSLLASCVWDSENETN